MEETRREDGLLSRGGGGEGGKGRAELMFFGSLCCVLFFAAFGLDSFVITQIEKSVVDGKSGCAKQ